MRATRRILNNHLPGQGGLNDQTRQTCKNLEYAIAIATRPGQIEYYQPPEEAKRIVENGELSALTHKIARLQREIDQVSRQTLDPEVTTAQPAARFLTSIYADLPPPRECTLFIAKNAKSMDVRNCTVVKR